MIDNSGGIEQSASERFCHNCGTPNPETHNFCLRCGVRINLLRPLPEIPDRLPGRYPIRFDVEYPERLSRLLIFVKWWLLAIPQLLIVYALNTVSSVIGFIAWFAILFTKRYPKGLFDVVVGFNRWGANVTAYTGLLRDEYPPFATDSGRYPVRYEVDYPEKLNRWLIFVKWLIAFPHYIVLQILWLIAFLVWSIGWFAILFTGRFPRGMFNFIVGVMRWNFRVSGYTSLLRDEYPPFSLAAEAGPASRRTVILSSVAAALFIPIVIGGIIALATIDVSQTHEVQVRYADALAGEPSASVDIEGNYVTLLGADDPYSNTLVRDPRPGHRLVRIQIEVFNYNALFSFVAEENFRLKDSLNDDHGPLYIQAPGSDQLVSEGETIIAGAVFELRDVADPAELTYAPGFAAFFPIGERVRFEFR